WARLTDVDLAEVFSGQGYGPAPLTDAEAAYVVPPMEDWLDAVRYDYPDWLEKDLKASLGDDLQAVMATLQARAPLHLRINAKSTTRAQVETSLAQDGIMVEAHPLATTALSVTSNPRRIRQSSAYRNGMVELQDAASQAVVEIIGSGTGCALDYCAGGGGKALALAAQGWSVTAHDVAPERMKDIPARAARAGTTVDVLTSRSLTSEQTFDLVLVDAPCSGAGAWRRQPEARWSLTPDRLAALHTLQDQVLDHAITHVAPHGRLAYVTCSLLRSENQDRLRAFLTRSSGWRVLIERTFSPLEGGDGFFVAMIERSGG
ncbi:MAG: RsmB/NOP family class I SAM-dependent RNA methyltransferase, partial [Pseudomonadota bacterium]